MLPSASEIIQLENYHPRSQRSLSAVSGGKVIPLDWGIDESLRYTGSLPEQVSFFNKLRWFDGGNKWLLILGVLISLMGFIIFSSAFWMLGTIWGLLIFMVGGFMVLIWWGMRPGKKELKPAIVVTKEGVKLWPTGEFLWGNVAEICFKKYKPNANYLLIQLRNGTIVEHQLNALHDMQSNSSYRDYYGPLRQALYFYWQLYQEQ